MAKQATGQPLRSAGRMLEILESFTSTRPSLSAAEISSELGIAVSTVRRLLHVLEHHGFVRSDPQTGRFAPHYQVVRLAAVAVQGNDLLSAASAPLDTLRDRVDEAVQLSVRSGAEAIFIDRRETNKLIKIFSDIGSRNVSWDGRASGKILLAWLPEATLEELLPEDNDWPIADGPNAARSLSAFRDRLAEVREQGYAINDEETAHDVWAVGAPIRDYTGEVVAALTVPVLKIRAVEQARIYELTKATLESAEEISRSLGYYGSTA